MVEQEKANAQVTFVVPTRERPGTAARLRLRARLRGMLPRGSEVVLSAVSGGAAHARNVGAGYAHGEVLAFVDDDVRLNARWDWARWLDEPWDYATARLYWPARSADTAAMRLEASMLNALVSVFRYKLMMSGFAVVRRAAFAAVGGYNTEVTYEEPDLTRRLRRLGRRGARLPVTVRVLRPWDSWSPYNDTTSRAKPHPKPNPEDIEVFHVR